MTAEGGWLRGNLHAHTTCSDGRCEPRDVTMDYAARGYDFLMISDHDRLSSPDELRLWTSPGLILLRGNEISSDGAHILHVNAGTRVLPYADRQTVLAAIGKDPESFAVVCHPNWLLRNHAAHDEINAWSEHVPLDLLMQWKGYVGIEIFNGAVHRLDGSALATDKWDRLLAAGHRVWGFANDDSHRSNTVICGEARRPDATPLMKNDVGLGWNVVWACKNVTSIVDALRCGRFYASTGQAIRSIAVEGNAIRIDAPGADRIVAIREVGRRFAQGRGPCWEVEVPPDAVYVRIECYGPGESRAFTQPFWPNEEKKEKKC